MPEKLQLYELYVYYVVHICDFGMLRVKYHSDICLDYPKIISEKWNLAVNFNCQEAKIITLFRPINQSPLCGFANFGDLKTSDILLPQPHTETNMDRCSPSANSVVE